jgi:hypothetical protein
MYTIKFVLKCSKSLLLERPVTLYYIVVHFMACPYPIMKRISLDILTAIHITAEQVVGIL